jgi:hypothetical protein
MPATPGPKGTHRPPRSTQQVPRGAQARAIPVGRRAHLSRHRSGSAVSVGGCRRRVCHYRGFLSRPFRRAAWPIGALARTHAHRVRVQAVYATPRGSLARPQADPDLINRLRRQPLITPTTHRNLLDHQSQKCCVDPLRPPAEEGVGAPLDWISGSSLLGHGCQRGCDRRLLPKYRTCDSQAL